MAAAGKVITGYSLPYVAEYSASGGTITYSNGQKLARGVNVSVEPNSSDANIFYADNIEAENVPSTFTNGTATLTVDGLFQATEKFICGLATADADGFINYGDDQNVPTLGIGFVVRYMSDGVTTYAPVILTKASVTPQTLAAATQEESIDFQTQELVFNIYRDDSSNHNWKRVGGELTTEALAEKAIKDLFNIA